MVLRSASAAHRRPSSVDAWVQLIIAMVGWVGTGLGWWFVGMWDKARGICLKAGDVAVQPECDVTTLMTLHSNAFLVSGSGLGRVGIGRCFGDGHNTGRHEKAPGRCPCCWQAVHHGAPWTRVLTSQLFVVYCIFYNIVPVFIFQSVIYSISY